MNKAPVERASKIKMAANYLGNFDFPAPVSFEVVGEGRIASNYIIGFGGAERFILRTYDLKQGHELGYGKERFAFEATVLKFIEEQCNFGTPALLQPVQKGELPFYEQGDVIVMLYKMLDGCTLEQSQLTQDTAVQAARVLRELADAFVTFEPVPDAPSGSISYIFDITKNLESRAPELFDIPAIREMSDYVAAFPRTKDLDSSPHGVVHGDFFFENTLWDEKGRLTGVIDFGDCFYGPILHDIVIGAMEFSILEGEEFQEDAFNAFLSEFSDWFSKNDIDGNLFVAVLLANCVRYSTHLMALGLDEDLPQAELLSADYNPYIKRFELFSDPAFLVSARKYFPK